MTVEAYPLQWPAGWKRTPGHRRERARFGKARVVNYSFGGAGVTRGELTVAQALSRLNDELERLGARNPVCSTNVELRLDGQPRSGQRNPEDPGAAVYFTLDGEQHCLPCDKWDRVADNIAAVAKHIEATRGIARWGVGDIKAAFAGFRQLPNPAAQNWRDMLCLREVPVTLDNIESQYRKLAAKHHPDRGGSVEKMTELNAARLKAREAVS